MTVDNLKLFQKTYDFLLWVKSATQRFAKVHKYSLGIQLENEVLEFMKQIVRANMESTKYANGGGEDTEFTYGGDNDNWK